MKSVTNTEKEDMRSITIDVEAIDVTPNKNETEKQNIEDNNAVASANAADKTAVSSADQPVPTLSIPPEVSCKIKLEPTREIPANFEPELQVINSLIQKIGGKKKELKTLPVKYNNRLKTLFERFLFVNKHNKKDVCIFALKYGQLLNSIESKFEKKHKFTEWRAMVFANVSERSVQKWQQAARIGKMAFHFSEFGLDAVLELDYLVKTGNEEFNNVTEDELINVLQDFINLGGWSSDNYLIRNGIDSAVTNFRLLNALNKKNITGMANLIAEIKPQLLQMVKMEGGALEETDAQQIADKIKDLPSDEERRQFLNNYTMDKCAVGSIAQNIHSEENRLKNSRGANEAIIRLNSRLESKNINELDLNEDQAIKAFKNLIKYFRFKNIDINAITKEA